MQIWRLLIIITGMILLEMPEQKISLEEKIGQTIIIGFHGTEPRDEEVQTVLKLLANNLLGGVILYDYNIVSPKQLKRLTDALYRANRKAFIAVDQEGGRVQRLTVAKGFRGTKESPATIAKIYPRYEDAYAIYLDTARELKEYHININFGPGVDLNNPDFPCPVIGGLERSYGDDPVVVSNYARHFIRAHRAENILTCIKHFPGHGYAQHDSHLPGIVDTTLTAQCNKEMYPYQQLMDSDDVDMIMTAHIVNEEYDPKKYPATLSKKIVPQLLRNLGYDNVVVSDDLHMGTIQARYSLEQIVYRAKRATCDLLVFSNNPSAARGVEGFKPDVRICEKIIDVIKTAIANKRIDEERVIESYQRVVKMRARLESRSHANFPRKAGKVLTRPQIPMSIEMIKWRQKDDEWPAEDR